MERYSERYSHYSERERMLLVRGIFKREAIKLYNETRNPETRRIAEKLLLTLELKERLEKRAVEVEKDRQTYQPQRRGASEISHESKDRSTQERGGSEPPVLITRKPPQQFGIFWAVEAIAEKRMKDNKSGLSLKKGDPYIELHLPPVPEDKRTLQNVLSSLGSLASYIELSGLTPKYIMGITYERLANVSEKLGFTVINPDIPDELRDSIERVNKIAVREGLKDHFPGELLLVFQKRETFLKNFLPQEE